MVKTMYLWFKDHYYINKFSLKSFHWAYAPSWSAFIFAVRTTIASFLALTIAIWLEMDSPKWAPTTVWICARNSSRGETISKAYWRAVGTIFGAMAAVIFVSMFPQQPWLFNITVALFVSVCVWFGTSMQSFKAYAMVLSGYTCAIIAFGSIHNPNNIFMMAMSRSTYILLGVLSDSFVGRFFDVNIDKKAREQLKDNLLFAIQGTIRSVQDMLAGKEEFNDHAQKLLTSVINFNNSIEFRQVEMHKNDCTGDHAYAALYSVTAVLARAMGLSIHMQHFKKLETQFQELVQCVQDCLAHLQKSLKQHNFLQEKETLNRLRWQCRQHIADSFYRKFTENDPIVKAEERRNVINRNILFRGLSELLGELQLTLDEYYKSNHPVKRDRFNFHVSPPLNYASAWKNCLRTFVAIMMACFIWYITSWDKGGTAAALTGMGCARFCLFENPAQRTFNRLKGSLYAFAAGCVLMLYLIPPVTNIEMLYVVMFIPTLLGGLAMANPKTLSVGAAYSAYLPYMLVLDNQSRMDEVAFFNNPLPLFLGIICSIISFRVIYPYSPLKTRLHLRRMLLKKMQLLAKEKFYVYKPRHWLFQIAGLFVTMIRQLNATTNTKLTQAYSLGTLAVMLIGLNVLRLKTIIRHDVVPDDIRILLNIVLKRISKFSGRYGRTTTVAHNVIKRLRQKELYEENLAVRMEIIAAISSLIIIVKCLDRNAIFLDVTHPFLLKEEKE